MFRATLLAGAASLTLAACGEGASDGGSGGGAVIVGGAGPGGFGAGGGSGGTGSGGTAALGGTGATGGGWFPCSDSDIESEVRDIVAKEAPCFSGSISFGHSPPPMVNFHIFPGGYVPMWLSACTSPPSEGEEALEQAVGSALAGRVECVTGDQLAVSFDFDGGAQPDAYKMREAISQACSSLLNHQDFAVVIDAAGKVTAIECDPSLKELEQCVQGALAGLTFPCLSSFKMCSKYMYTD